MNYFTFDLIKYIDFDENIIFSGSLLYDIIY